MSFEGVVEDVDLYGLWQSAVYFTVHADLSQRRWGFIRQRLAEIRRHTNRVSSLRGTFSDNYLTYLRRHSNITRTRVPEHQREEADIKFKSVSQAYEILHDEDKRHLYDTHGMSAFDGSRPSGGGMGAEVDLDDILQQMFGMGGGGMPPGIWRCSWAKTSAQRQG